MLPAFLTKRSISFRLAFAAMLVGLLLSMIFGSVRLTLEISQRKQEIQSELQVIIEAVKNSAAQAAYSLDKKLAEKIVQGMLSYPAVQYAEITDDFDSILASASQPTKNPVDDTFSLLVPEKTDYAVPLEVRENTIGELRFVLDPNYYRTQFTRNIVRTVVMDIGTYLLLGAVLFFMFHMFSTRPFLKLGRSLASLDPRQPGKTQIPVPKTHTHDELGTLIHCINGFIMRIQESMDRRTTAEDELRRSEVHYRSLFENTGSATVLFGDDSIITRCNEEFVNLSGLDREQIEGIKKWSDFVHPDDLKRMSGYHKSRTASNGKAPQQYEFSFMDGLGNEKSVMANISVMPDNRIRVASLLNISELKDAQRRLEAAKTAAEAANLAKSSFLANMSHEIRTPLNGVLGMLQILKQSRLDQEQEELVHTASVSGKSLLTLINDILDLSKMDADKLEPAREPFDLHQTIEDLRADFSTRVSGKTIRFHTTVSPDIPKQLLGDEPRLRQILFNLIGNAFKFTESGEIGLDVHKLNIESKKDTVRILFTVHDTGIGIPDEHLDSIFNTFSQADTSLTRKYQGAGLGLSIVKNLITLMGGNISVVSEPGFGTMVHFSLPFPVADAPLQPAAPKDEYSRTRPFSFLLVEDEPVNRSAAKMLLKGAGHSVDEVLDGSQAVEAAKTNDYDCILMDIQMPNMDGLTATRLIREYEKSNGKAYTPIIALTAHAMQGDKERFLENGMDGYISKPFEIDQLIQIVTQAVRTVSTA